MAGGIAAACFIILIVAGVIIFKVMRKREEANLARLREANRQSLEREKERVESVNVKNRE